MRNRHFGMGLALAMFLCCSQLASSQVIPAGKLPKLPDSGKEPDLFGIWMQDQPPATADQFWVYELRKEEPPMTAWGEEQYKAAKPSFGPHAVSISNTNDVVYQKCLPPGMPRIFAHPFPMQIIQAPGEVILLFEYDSMRRQIFTDGRPHDTSLGPSWMGDSIGHWEQDTLVVDTVNFQDHGWVDRVGHPHTEALHVVEHIRRINHDHLIDDITIEDPKAYTKPWTARLDFLLRPTWTLGEQFCEDSETFQEIEKKETSPAK
jgi:hypothetical protein